LRPRVWERVREHFGDRVGFLATSLCYRDRGALREALRRLGVPYGLWVAGRCGVCDRMRERVLALARSLEGRRYALARHCGGLVLFPGEVPGSVRVAREADPLLQTSLEKTDVASVGKVDVLSNRALGHLYLCGVGDPWVFPGEDEGAGGLFSRGDSWGIVQAESPAMRKVLLALGARTRAALVLALGLVRPAAGAGKTGAVGRNPLERLLIYEDDVTELLGVALGCSPGGAEAARRALSGGGPEALAVLARVDACVGGRGRLVFRGVEMSAAGVRRQLGMAKAFAFCKAHATAYGSLAWALGMVKANNPRLFWEGFVNSGALAGSMYWPWVHFERVKQSLGVRVVWPGDLGLRPAGYYSVSWKFCGDVFGPDLPLGVLAPGMGADRSSWIRQLGVAGFWEGGFGPVPGTWVLDGDGGRVGYRALTALKDPRCHPLGDGRVCWFSTLGYGRLGLLERSWVAPEGTVVGAAFFERGSGFVSGRFPGGLRVGLDCAPG
jgi:hypothetical protein